MPVITRVKCPFCTGMVHFSMFLKPVIVELWFNDFGGRGHSEFERARIKGNSLLLKILLARSNEVSEFLKREMRTSPSFFGSISEVDGDFGMFTEEECIFAVEEAWLRSQNQIR